MSDIFRPGDAVEGRVRWTTVPFPSYSYVPGCHPHPVSDPAGHSYGESPDVPPPLDVERWWESSTYLYAIDLFNHGYYWEAHEAWEALWHAAGRRGREADWLKGLIKLAAAAVKLREGNATGVRRHARRAAELLKCACADGSRFAGVDVGSIRQLLDTLQETPSAKADLYKLLPLVLRVEGRDA